MRALSCLLLLLCLGGTLIVCNGIPLVLSSTTRASILGRPMASTTKADDSDGFPVHSHAPRTTMLSATVATPQDIRYSARKCDIRSGADSAASVPKTIGVDQEMLSCLTCMANGTQEVHALLVNEPVPVGSLHSPQNNRHDDIDVYLETSHQLSPTTLILGSRKSVSWHIIADVKVTPLKEVILISPEDIESDFDARWPHRTSPLALGRDEISVKTIHADIGHLKNEGDLQLLFKTLGPGSFVTSLTTIHRTYVWRLQVGVESKCSGYKEPFKDPKDGSCTGRKAAIIAVVTCGIIGLAIVIIACVVYRSRRDRKSPEKNVAKSEKENTIQNKPPLDPSEFDEVNFGDQATNDSKLKEDGTISSKPGNFYFNPEVDGHRERMAQQEEMLRY